MISPLTPHRLHPHCFLPRVSQYDKSCYSSLPPLTSSLLRQNASLDTLSAYTLSDSTRHKSSATPMSGAQNSHQNIPMTSGLQPSTPKQNEISDSISYRKHIWVDVMIREHQTWLTNSSTATTPQRNCPRQTETGTLVPAFRVG